MLENFKPISLILFAGALCFPKSVYLELVLAKQGSSILKGASVAALYGSRAGNRNGSLKRIFFGDWESYFLLAEAGVGVNG